MRLRVGGLLPLLGLAAALGACRETATPKTEPAARVNGALSSAQQVRYAVERAEARGALSSAQMLERIIDQELLVQKAQHAGLERDPRVKDTLETVRRAVLAHAYIDQMASEEE